MFVTCFLIFSVLNGYDNPESEMKKIRIQIDVSDKLIEMHSGKKCRDAAAHQTQVRSDFSEAFVARAPR